MNGGALPILYLDDWLVVIDKPTGLLVHRSPVDARETRFAVQTLRDQLGRYVYPVHRLDKGTSGALTLRARRGYRTRPLPRVCRHVGRKNVPRAGARLAR